MQPFRPIDRRHAELSFECRCKWMDTVQERKEVMRYAAALCEFCKIIMENGKWKSSAQAALHLAMDGCVTQIPQRVCRAGMAHTTPGWQIAGNSVSQPKAMACLPWEKPLARGEMDGCQSVGRRRGRRSRSNALLKPLKSRTPTRQIAQEVVPACSFQLVQQVSKT